MNNAICSNMDDLDIIILSKLSQTKINVIWYHLYVESKKNDTNTFFYKQKYAHRLENKLMLNEGNAGS